MSTRSSTTSTTAAWRSPGTERSRPKRNASPSRLWLVASLAAPLGCGGCGGPETEPRAPSPSVTLEFLDREPVRFGELREARLTVLNTTFEPILIRSIHLPEQLPFCQDLMTSLEGRLREKAVFEQFHYYPDLRGQTPRFFADDTLLFPGEQTSLEPVVIRCRLVTQGITLRYQSIPLPDLLARAYFPDDDPRGSSMLRFRRISYSQLRGYRTARPGTLGRTVLIRDADSLGVSLLHHVRVPVELSDPETPGRVVETAGASVETRVTRWHSRDLWILDDPASSETFGYREGGDPIPLPRCDLMVFDLLDRLAPPGLAVPVLGEGSGQLKLASAGEVGEFLERARSREQRVTLDTLDRADGNFENVLALESLPRRGPER